MIRLLYPQLNENLRTKYWNWAIPAYIFSFFAVPIGLVTVACAFDPQTRNEVVPGGLCFTLITGIPALIAGIGTHYQSNRIKERKERSGQHIFQKAQKSVLSNLFTRSISI
jgi:hypothetical protein